MLKVILKSVVISFLFVCNIVFAYVPFLTIKYLNADNSAYNCTINVSQINSQKNHYYISPGEPKNYVWEFSYTQICSESACNPPPDIDETITMNCRHLKEGIKDFTANHRVYTSNGKYFLDSAIPLENFLKISYTQFEDNNLVLVAKVITEGFRNNITFKDLIFQMCNKNQKCDNF